MDGFRGINHLEMGDFGQVNLLVGKNNCCKTSVLESIFLLTGPSNPQLPVNINTLRNIIKVDENFWRLFFYNLNTESDIQLTGELKNPKEKRRLSIKPNRGPIPYPDPAQKSDMASTPSTTTTKGNLSAPLNMINGLDLNYRYSPTGSKAQSIATTISYSSSGIHMKGAQKYQENRKGSFFNTKHPFLDLASMFSNVQLLKKTSAIIKILKKIEPAIENLTLGDERMIYCDVGLARLVPINIMGDGISKILSIILYIFNTQDGVVLIDEVENGLHHTSQKIAWDAIIASAEEFNVQIFGTTHSMECISAFSESAGSFQQFHKKIRLHRLEKEDDSFRAITYDYQDIASSLESDWEVR